MFAEYIYYITDDSFDYGDFPGATYKDIAYHGFGIEIDKDNNINLDTLEGYGDFATEIKKIKTLKELKEFLQTNRDSITEWDKEMIYPNEELFEEVEEIVNENIEKVKNEILL